MRPERMRLESSGPRTWLLAGTAGWAVLVLLLALSGMGGRVAPLPDDAALLRPLPVPPRPAPERLAPLAQYAEIANRPLFADDRRPHPFALQPQNGAEQPRTFDYVLTSVMITPTFRMAILQAPDNRTAPLRIRLGETHESLPGWRLQALDARSALFVGPEGERRLQLRVYSGVGGEAPTAGVTPLQRPAGQPVAVPPQPPATAAPEADRAPPASPEETPPPESGNAAEQAPAQPMTEQAQMEAIRKRIEARRAQLRQEALLEQQLQQQNQKPPVK